MDGVLRFMKQHDIPLTRENYLDVAYLGNPPEELSAEQEAELPEQFQAWDVEWVLEERFGYSRSVMSIRLPSGYTT